MISNDFSINNKSTFLIVTEKEDLNPTLLSSLEQCDFTDKFEIECSQGKFYIWMFGGISESSELSKTQLYNSIDLYTELGRCMVIDWTPSKTSFEVYGIPSNIDLNLAYGISSSNPLQDRIEFIDIIKRDLSDYNYAGLVGAFFRCCVFYSDFTDLFIAEIRKRKYWKYF